MYIILVGSFGGGICQGFRAERQHMISALMGSMYRRSDYGTGISWQECMLMLLRRYSFCDDVCVMVNKHRTQYVPPWIIRQLAGNHGGIFYVKK